MLAKIPEEIVHERIEYFTQQARDKEEAMANDLIKGTTP
jgi:hypothetical protein